MADPTITAAHQTIAEDVQFGDGVIIEADSIDIGAGAQIGVADDDDFRTPPGVRIRVSRLTLGPGTRIGPGVSIRGGEVELGANVRIEPMTTIDVADRISIGDGGFVGVENEIIGRHVEIGQELWTGPRARIGGGSAFEVTSRLVAGHFLHLGLDTFVNTARPVTIGHEVGLGTRTSIYTHGAYPSRLKGFPVAFEGVAIGDFTWVPGATINPGVRIGRNCVIGVGSLVTANIPDGALAAGVPAKVIREGAYPRPLSQERLAAFRLEFLQTFATLLRRDEAPTERGGGVELRTPEARYVMASVGDEAPQAATRVLVVGDNWLDGELPAGWTAFDTEHRRIGGMADQMSARLANELRRHGIRFYSRAVGDRYENWDVEVPRHEDSTMGTTRSPSADAGR